jgi:hypothetical protein
MSALPPASASTYQELYDLGFTKCTPYQHQLRVWEEAREREAFAVLWEMGLGKSLYIIMTAAWLWSKGLIDGVITIGNKGSYRNWVDKEVPEHWPNAGAATGVTPGSTTAPQTATASPAMSAANRSVQTGYWSSYATKEVQGQLEALLRVGAGTLPWLTINVEAFSTDGADAFLAAYRKRYKRLLIVVDESTTIKAPKSKRAKKVVKLCRTGAYRRIMTGSPLPESPLDAWAQYKALGDDMLGYPSFVAFKRRFAVEEIKQFGSRSFIQVVGYQNLDELGRRMATCSSRLTKAECLDLPDKVYETVHVEMEPEQRRVYKKLRDELLVEMDSGMITSAPHALTKLVRLHQVALGYLVGDEGGIEDLSDGRYNVLWDLLEEAGDAQTIVWSNFRHPLSKVVEGLQKRYGVKSVVAYHGGVSETGRRDAMERFLSGEARYFVSNPSVGGYGITLTNCNNVVYFSNGFKSEARLQSEDRCHRIGQTNKVTYTDIVARGTIDERVLDALASKRDLAESVLGDRLRELLR